MDRYIRPLNEVLIQADIFSSGFNPMVENEVISENLEVDIFKTAAEKLAQKGYEVTYSKLNEKDFSRLYPAASEWDHRQQDMRILFEVGAFPASIIEGDSDGSAIGYSVNFKPNGLIGRYDHGAKVAEGTVFSEGENLKFDMIETRKTQVIFRSPIKSHDRFVALPSYSLQSPMWTHITDQKFNIKDRRNLEFLKNIIVNLIEKSFPVCVESSSNI